jgi:hypothetical protein
MPVGSKFTIQLRHGLTRLGNNLTTALMQFALEVGLGSRVSASTRAACQRWTGFSTARRLCIPAGGQIVITGNQRKCLGADKLELLFDPKSQLAAL